MTRNVLGGDIVLEPDPVESEIGDCPPPESLEGGRGADIWRERIAIPGSTRVFFPIVGHQNSVNP